MIINHGVRGSIPNPSYQTLGYGGITPCVEIKTKKYQLIFDCDSGFSKVKLCDDRQIIIFISLLLAIAVVTVWYCLKSSSSVNQEKEYFLAGGSLKWYFVAGSITLTNLSTDQLVGMNGNQMALLAWWELAAVAGLCMLCFIFIPIYYKYNCTTTTELL